MRIRNNKLINFILEFSQIMLVFLGVYSALMCTASSLDMINDGKLCLLLLFAASIVFYGLFTVLETFRKGKLYGLIGITMFFLALVIRFKGALLKGIVSAANSFLKERLKNNGYWYGREWPYKNVKPCIIAEKYMEDSISKDLKDYKFFCFNGSMEFFDIDID